MTAVAELSLPLAELGKVHLLFGGAGLISLVAFVTLVLVPAVGAYGRIWEKAAAGFLSLFVLVALILVGVAVGLMIVYYYNDITDLFSQG